MTTSPTRRTALVLTAGAALAASAAVASRGLVAPPAPAPTRTGPSAPPDLGTAWPSGARTLSATAWKQDLAELDRQVRATHPDPFVIHPEREWVAGLAALRRALPGLQRDQAKIALIRQVALLDTHSGVFPEEVGFHQYGVAMKEFADGVFVTAATGIDAGARLVAIGGTTTESVLSRLRPLINADNASALHDLRPWFLAQVEVLHALAIVRDVARPAFLFRLPDGSTRTVDLPQLPLDDFSTLWSPGAPAGTPASWRACAGSTVTARIVDRAVVVSFTALDKDATGAIAAMRSALTSGRADRVVFDMRYCRGGDYTAADTMREALATSLVRDRLTVVTGSDNVSAGSVLAQWLQRTTSARLVGQVPPTIVNPMLNEVTFTLPRSGVIVHVPSDRWVFDAADHRRSILLDAVVRDRGEHFFRGIDDTLPRALR